MKTLSFESEQALLQSAEMYRRLTEDLPAFVVAFLPDGTLTFANNAVAKPIGISPAELIGRNFYDFLPRADRAKVKTKLAQLTPEHAVETHEQTTQLPGGAMAYHQWTNRAFFDAGGRAIYFQVLGEDITQRRRFEEQLRIAAIAFESQTGVAVMDANRVLLRVNGSLCRMIGYAEGELVGRTPMVLRSPAQASADFEMGWTEVQRLGEWSGELLLRRKTHEDLAARVSLTAVKDANGVVSHFVANIQDLSSTQQAERQRVVDEAAHRDTLVREVHHRIKNNLQGVIGLLRHYVHTNPDMEGLIKHAIGQVQSVAVIHGLQGRFGSKAVRLCDLTQDIAESTRALWPVTVSVDIPVGWRTVTIEEKEAVPISLVINELILNAVKHRSDLHGRVTIALRTGDQSGSVQIRIVNTGRFALQSPNENHHQNGLRLVAALLPTVGASMRHEQQGDQVVTVLALAPPVIFTELKVLP